MQRLYAILKRIWKKQDYDDFFQNKVLKNIKSRTVPIKYMFRSLNSFSQIQ